MSIVAITFRNPAVKGWEVCSLLFSSRYFCTILSNQNYATYVVCGAYLRTIRQNIYNDNLEWDPMDNTWTFDSYRMILLKNNEGILVVPPNLASRLARRIVKPRFRRADRAIVRRDGKVKQYSRPTRSSSLHQLVVKWHFCARVMSTMRKRKKVKKL